MKNVIEIDMTKDSYCELVSNIDDGTNSVILKIKGITPYSSYFYIPSLDYTSTFFFEEEEIELYTTKYELDWLIGSGSFVFQLVGTNGPKTYAIEKIEGVNGNLILKQINDYTFQLTDIKTKSGNTLTFYEKSTDITLEAINSIYQSGELIGGITYEVTEELEAGTWLMNFNVKIYDLPRCIVNIYLGRNWRTTNVICHPRLSDDQETISFSFLVTKSKAFKQSLFIDCDTNDNDISGTGSGSIQIHAIKIA